MSNRKIEITAIPLNTDPMGYVADEALIQAVEIAIALNKPLVVSGEPGTGKTQLASWVAARLHEQTQGDPVPFHADPVVFNTKSGSSATDLFYYYDAVRHFQAQGPKPTENFIELNAMGLAIGRSHGTSSPDMQALSGLRQFQELNEKPQSSVVLIDEIDKAPRDFPNDLLNEIENYKFGIKELNKEIKMGKDARIVVIMTSNSEKTLPNAFLRRCVFYHIPFPGPDKLMQIAAARMSVGDPAREQQLGEAIQKFIKYREKAVNKKPATSEFLDWVMILEKYGLLKDSPLGEYTRKEEEARRQLYRSSLNTLFKNREDLDRA
ncbi:MAG: MoxR family ATPase [Bacteroidetes bacterium]|nr:MoxR family ATPase [Bacteroidota bacterium]